VGILENIVASMTTSSSSRSNTELQAQYDAQVDVLEHLGRKVQKLLESSGGRGDGSGGAVVAAGTSTAKTKLARDFGRVQAQAGALQDRVARFRKATTAAVAATAPAASSSSAPDYHQQVQLQLQQDVR
jgi:hypothetical protein